jgi:hypothetical protein
MAHSAPRHEDVFLCSDAHQQNTDPASVLRDVLLAFCISTTQPCFSQQATEHTGMYFPILHLFENSEIYKAALARYKLTSAFKIELRLRSFTGPVEGKTQNREILHI